tara:strand:+ start:1685 stop:2044 length:360 start_codon:yes stop_codon:yes gene_type:complete
MVVKGRYEIEFDIIMDNGYTMPFDILQKFFRQYTLESILSYNSDHVFMDSPNYNYTPIFKYFCDRRYIIAVSSGSPYYRIMDKPKFLIEFESLTEQYKDISINYSVYEREFLIDNVCKD